MDLESKLMKLCEENGVRDFEGNGHYSNYIFMWSIGMKDIHEKDIYEGDIDSYRSVVTYVDGSDNANLGMDIGWYLQRDNFESWRMIEVGEEIEVLGNIFENPELLER